MHLFTCSDSSFQDIPVSKELAELCEALQTLHPNLLLRHGGSTKLQGKSLLAVEVWPQPKVLGNSHNSVP